MNQIERVRQQAQLLKNFAAEESTDGDNKPLTIRPVVCSDKVKEKRKKYLGNCQFDIYPRDCEVCGDRQDNEEGPYSSGC